MAEDGVSNQGAVAVGIGRLPAPSARGQRVLAITATPSRQAAGRE